MSASFYSKELLDPRPTLELEERTLSTIRNPLLLHPQSEDELVNLSAALWGTLISSVLKKVSYC
jgi:hypothetical protein